MHIVVINGSHRPNAQSLRIANYLAPQVTKLEASATTDIVNLTSNPIPLWDDSAKQSGSELGKLWQPYGERLTKADGYIVISPEWNGMVPAGLKNLFLYTSSKEVGHKPALIVTVSETRGGAYPVEELRISSYKNCRICYIPEHLIVRDAPNMFNGTTSSGKDDEYLRGRADFAIRTLLSYAQALKPMRESGIVFDKKYANGM